MAEAMFSEMMNQVDMLSYFQRMALLKRLVDSFDTPKKQTKSQTAELCNDAFGIWKDTDISLKTIREKAWR